MSGPCYLNEDSNVVGGHLGREGQPRNGTWDRDSSARMRSYRDFCGAAQNSTREPIFLGNFKPQ